MCIYTIVCKVTICVKIWKWPIAIQSNLLSPTDNKPLARLNSTFPGPHFLQRSSHQGYQVETIGTMMLMTLQKRNRRNVLTHCKEGLVRRTSSEERNRLLALKKEFDLALVLLFIVGVFFACNILKACLNAFEFFHLMFVGSEVTHVTLKNHDWYNALNDVSNFLIIVNSAFNFMIYICASTPFRKAFRKTCSSVKTFAFGNSKTFVKSSDTTNTTTTSLPLLSPRQPGTSPRRRSASKTSTTDTEGLHAEKIPLQSGRVAHAHAVRLS